MFIKGIRNFFDQDNQNHNANPIYQSSLFENYQRIKSPKFKQLCKSNEGIDLESNKGMAIQQMNLRKQNTNKTANSIEKQDSQKDQQITLKKQHQSTKTNYNLKLQENNYEGYKKIGISSAQHEQQPSFLNVFNCLTTKNIERKKNSNQNTIQLDPAKCSKKKCGLIQAYAALTTQGLIRSYNEDRVSIILNILQPHDSINKESQPWPKCAFFAVYDGHGGEKCAEFLRDQLHAFVVKQKEFPKEPKVAIWKGFKEAERTFLAQAVQKSPSKLLDRSGSCAIVAILVGNECFIANVGDSRAVMSTHKGSKVFQLSQDQKPSEKKEKERIINNGGKIYQSQAQNLTSSEQSEPLYGPTRVIPGRLSVSRTFGDAEAKLPQFDGNPKVVIAEPEITSFKISPEQDFIILASQRKIFNFYFNR